MSAIAIIANLMNIESLADLASPDSIRFYMTGAASDDAPQPDPDLSLGGFKSQSETGGLAYSIVSFIPNIQIKLISETNEQGIATLTSVANDTLVFTPDDGQAGPAVEIFNGDELIILGADPNKWVRVERLTDEPLVGQTIWDSCVQFNNVIGQLDHPPGTDTYRAIMIKIETFVGNGFGSTIQFWLDRLDPNDAPVAVTFTTPTGTLEVDTDSVKSWPRTGYFHAYTDDTYTMLATIGYYDSRTDDSLNVTERGLLGSASGNVDAGYVLVSVPGIALGFEFASPKIGGNIQTIADEFTAPAAITWLTDIVPNGIFLMVEDELLGIWIWRQIPAGAIGYPEHDIKIIGSYTIGLGTPFDSDFQRTLWGKHRVPDTSVVQFELFVGQDAIPDLGGTPDAIFTSLPHVENLSLTPDHIYYIVTQQRNQYNMLSQSQDFFVLDLKADNTIQEVRPSGPSFAIVESLCDGTFRVRASYPGIIDPEVQRADTWQVFAKFNVGSPPGDPDPEFDTPVSQTLMTSADTVDYLDAFTAVQADDTYIKVAVVTLRSSDSRQSLTGEILEAHFVSGSLGPVENVGTC